jgi:hypothetical protein
MTLRTKPVIIRIHQFAARAVLPWEASIIQAMKK